MSQIVRKQMEANSTEVFQIDSPTTAFLVKNYTGGPAFVCAEKQNPDTDSTMIAAGTAEVVQVGVFLNVVTVRTSSAGIVEVGRFDGRYIYPLTGGGSQGQGSGQVPDASIAADEEFSDMMDDIFGDNTTQDGNNSIDDNP